jgi:hypothetical protein
MTEATRCPPAAPGCIDIYKIKRKIAAFRFVGREINDMGMR